eukprot:TRINITY_DN13328_c0_g3_i1.p1 TRINITY_DN13328_c0_g3~~TRINITY_DN13328_c0_g3_i1.p1  ORF type:complete len:101 (+),score=2.34 TRINITY_DN13328_c0_g3_i1:390-692(+)
MGNAVGFIVVYLNCSSNVLFAFLSSMTSSSSFSPPPTCSANGSSENSSTGFNPNISSAFGGLNNLVKTSTFSFKSWFSNCSPTTSSVSYTHLTLPTTPYV